MAINCCSMASAALLPESRRAEACLDLTVKCTAPTHVSSLLALASSSSGSTHAQNLRSCQAAERHGPSLHLLQAKRLNLLVGHWPCSNQDSSSLPPYVAIAQSQASASAASVPTVVGMASASVALHTSAPFPSAAAAAMGLAVSGKDDAGWSLPTEPAVPAAVLAAASWKTERQSQQCRL